MNKILSVGIATLLIVIATTIGMFIVQKNNDQSLSFEEESFTNLVGTTSSKVVDKEEIEQTTVPISEAPPTVATPVADKTPEPTQTQGNFYIADQDSGSREVVFATGVEVGSEGYILRFGDGEEVTDLGYCAPTDDCVSPVEVFHTYKLPGVYTAELVYGNNTIVGEIEIMLE